MTREEVLKQILEIEHNNILIELPTGYGKTKIALDKAKSLNIKNILIVIYRKVHKITWETEIAKWWSDCNVDITYTTYRSLHKHIGTWDLVIFDETHHLSENCTEVLKSYTIKNAILLSATIKRELRQRIRSIFYNIKEYKVSFRNAIESKVLPDPIVYFIPLTLRNDIPTEAIYKNKNKPGKIIECCWKDRWNFIKQSKYPVRIYCTEQQYYYDLCSQIEYWKKRTYNTRSQIAKHKWLKLCGDRLKWLSDKKTDIVNDFLKQVKNYRTLTFCNSISQTEKLGKNFINSKNKKSNEILEAFNNGKIKHITACDMLNESMNLVNCKIGIYANLNNSDIIILQRAGRLLRHKNPIIVVFYYKDTREEELMNKMKENYNKDLINTVNSIYDINICK